MDRQFCFVFFFKRWRITKNTVCAFKMSADHPVKTGAVSDQIKQKNVSDWNDPDRGEDWKRCCLFHENERKGNNFLLLRSNLKNAS